MDEDDRDPLALAVLDWRHDPAAREQVQLTILAERAQGASLRSICADRGMPSLHTVYRWLREDEPFSRLYALAERDRADTLADEIMAITDDASLPRKERHFRISQRKWLAGVLSSRYREQQPGQAAQPPLGPPGLLRIEVVDPDRGERERPAIGLAGEDWHRVGAGVVEGDP